jgi:hypothetical protein
MTTIDDDATWADDLLRDLGQDPPRLREGRADAATWADDLRDLGQELLDLAGGDAGRAMLALGELTDNSSPHASVVRLRAARRKAAAAAVAAAGSKAAAARALGVPVLRVFRALAGERSPSRRPGRLRTP